MNENLKELWIELTELQSDFVDLKKRFDLLQMQIFSEIFWQNQLNKMTKDSENEKK